MKGPLFSKLSTVLISNLKLSQKLGFDALLSPIPQLIKMLRAKGKLGLILTKGVSAGDH